MFPGDYQFTAEFAPSGEPRIAQIAAFLHLLETGFAIDDWGDDHPKNGVTLESVRSAYLTAAKERKHPDLNTPLVRTFGTTDLRLRAIVCSGAKPVQGAFDDSVNLMFDGDWRKPDPKLFLDIIATWGAFQAQLIRCKGQREIEPQERIHRFGRYKPAALFGLDFFAERALTNLGGREYVLKTPAHRVSEYLNGVLIELVPGYYFNYENPEHHRIQQEAMRYLEIDR